ARVDVRPAARDDDAGEFLDALLVAFPDDGVDADAVADVEAAAVGLELRLVDFLDDVRHKPGWVEKGSADITDTHLHATEISGRLPTWTKSSTFTATNTSWAKPCGKPIAHGKRTRCRSARSSSTTGASSPALTTRWRR